MDSYDLKETFDCIARSLTYACDANLVQQTARDASGYISTLESQIAEAERTIAELRICLVKAESVNAGRVESDGRYLKALAEFEAERDEAKRVAVWAARSGVWCESNMMRGYLMHGFVFDEDNDLCANNEISCDGTDADVYLALREAKEQS